MGKLVSKCYIACTIFTAINVVLECLLYVFYLKQKFHTSCKCHKFQAFGEFDSDLLYLYFIYGVNIKQSLVIFFNHN